MDMLKKAPNCPFCRDPVEKICVVTFNEDGTIEVQEEIKKEAEDAFK
jgi:hypothetical protein